MGCGKKNCTLTKVGPHATVGSTAMKELAEFGAGVTQRLTGTGAEGQPPALVVAYTTEVGEEKAPGLATAWVAAGSSQKSTANPEPPFTAIFANVRSKVLCPPPWSQPYSSAGKAGGAGKTLSGTGTTGDWQPEPSLTCANTVVVPLEKAVGSGIGLVAVPFRNQLTVLPRPRLMIWSTLVRSNTACPFDPAQPVSEVELAGGPLLTVTGKV